MENFYQGIDIQLIPKESRMKHIPALLAVGFISCSLMEGIAIAQSASSTLSSASSVNGSSFYSGQITGNGVAQYGLNTQPSQQLTVTLSTRNPNTRMNVLKGNSEALCDGSATQNVCSFRAEPGASYRVQIFLLRDAALRGESTKFSLRVEPAS